MNRWIIVGGLAAALALPLLTAPTGASASCTDRKVTGTVVGGVGGALIGNSIARGGGGALLGGLGGAVLGHEVARSTCRHERYDYRHAEYRRRSAPHGPYQNGTYPGDAGGAPPPPQQVVYYDERGNIVGQRAPAPGADPSAACPTETQSYYDDRGTLVQRQVPTCAR